ncbi:Chromosomal replication initiator protein DnaA [Roseovarius sp. EC-HK134]|uniref:DnaA ATPase domain-containing protein n=1 Tax=unclassified Roseovarius TaxID=2614913 RepID=UPI00125587BC|nr:MULTISPECIES: DnaA/Hda family protein [unclassified Roseovarius]VVT33420.1 Chromosomal replication initiator protein DnaA [Roseovarius sp. EC-SD190]VVT33534.1 Chromosomal replication initiator protein DnaA [Roseovarius sp. EC-HK134]
MMPRQLSFDLPVRAALGREDFFVSPANAEAVAMIEGWQGWPGRKLILAGPSGAGKTHLAHVWAALSGAQMIAAKHIAQADIPNFASRPIVVEDADQIAGDRPSEEALFHLHNLVLAEGHSLLLTARQPPNLWPLVLPDLQSRMQGTMLTQLRTPDDTLLAAVLTKLFADRQIAPSPDTIPYLARRMDRSFDAAREVVAALDAAALAEGRAITRVLASQVLDKLAH